jgi:YggT family protein
MTSVILILIQVIDILYWVLFLLLLSRFLLELFAPAARHPVVRGLRSVLNPLTEPFLAPIRRWLGRSTTYQSYGWSRGALDTAPLIALVAVWLLHALLRWILSLWLAPPLWLFRPFQAPGPWLVGIVNLLATLYMWALLLRVVLDWIRLSITNAFYYVLWRITEPVLRPLRRVIPPIAGLDFSPLVALLLLRLLANALIRLIGALF